MRSNTVFRSRSCKNGEVKKCVLYGSARFFFCSASLFYCFKSPAHFNSTFFSCEGFMNICSVDCWPGRTRQLRSMTCQGNFSTIFIGPLPKSCQLSTMGFSRFFPNGQTYQTKYKLQCNATSTGVLTLLRFVMHSNDT